MFGQSLEGNPTAGGGADDDKPCEPVAQVGGGPQGRVSEGVNDQARMRRARATSSIDPRADPWCRSEGGGERWGPSTIIQPETEIAGRNNL